jgi:hypothetical protein
MIAKLSWRELVALTLLLWSAWDPAHAQAVVPDPTLTPGVVRTTDATDVCSHGTNQLASSAPLTPPTCARTGPTSLGT